MKIAKSKVSNFVVGLLITWAIRKIIVAAQTRRGQHRILSKARSLADAIRALPRTASVSSLKAL